MCPDVNWVKSLRGTSYETAQTLHPLGKNNKKTEGKGVSHSSEESLAPWLPLSVLTDRSDHTPALDLASFYRGHFCFTVREERQLVKTSGLRNVRVFHLLGKKID